MISSDLEPKFPEDLFETSVCFLINGVYRVVSPAIPRLLMFLETIVSDFFATSIAVNILVIVPIFCLFHLIFF